MKSTDATALAQLINDDILKLLNEYPLGVPSYNDSFRAKISGIVINHCNALIDND
jgi:hypothetical protein